MKRKVDNFRMFNDKIRMDIFLNYVDYFCIYFNVVVLFFQLLVVIIIFNDVLREVFDGFFYKERIEL